MSGYHFFLILFVTFPECILSLDISSCKQEWVPKLPEKFVYRVDCSNRGFESIPTDIPNVTAELLLNGNSISSIDHEPLKELKALRLLDLSNNEISTVDQSVFEQNTFLKRLDLSRNRLKCDWRLWWLVEFSTKLEFFSALCFSPRPLRGKLVQNITQEHLSVDCMSVKKLTGGLVDGEYSVRVYGHDNSETQLSVYCYDMKYEKPREYITLPSGMLNNYVNIAKDKTCLYATTDMSLAIFPMSNVTSYFTKVRVDLSTLQILTSDYQFASNAYLQYGQPALCGKTSCITGVAKIDLRGTYFQLKSNNEIIEERTCAEKCGLCEVSDSIQLDLINKETQPYPACMFPLGMQNNAIPNEKITSSSSNGKDSQSYHARLNSLTYSGWCASNTDGVQYLLVDLGKVKTLSGISTQGHKDNYDWVKEYKIMYSSNDNNYEIYQEFGRKTSLLGNTDKDTVVTHWFKPRIHTRFIRIHPQSWYDDGILEHKICMRVEFYGCEQDITSYILRPSGEEQCLAVNYNGARNGEIPLVKRPECRGEDFMFLYHRSKLLHTKTGFCLRVNTQLGIVLSADCESSNVMYQNVRLSSAEAFLIKDFNGDCARLLENETTKHLYAEWQYCEKGGFTILQMSREGVAAFGPSFSQTDVAIVTDLFKEISLTCKANADPYAVYEWKKDSPVDSNSENFKTTTRIDESIAVFRNISWSDRGRYQCAAWNIKGSATKSYQIIVNPLQWFELTPKDQNVIYGRNVIFQCLSRGIPDPETWWMLFDKTYLEYKNITDINFGKYDLLQDGSLEVKSITYEDETKYMCFSSSPRLQRNTTASLTVYVVQNFTTVPLSAHALYGMDVIFDCISEGEPTPKIEWKAHVQRYDRTIQLSNSSPDMEKYELLNNGSLRIKNVDLDDQGKYICVSRSPGLVRNVDADLTVYVTQEFLDEPESARILYGNNHTLSCLVVGTPTPDVAWLFQKGGFENATPLKDYKPDKYNILKNGSLVIFNAATEESGKYYCIAKSPGLVRNRSAIVDVYITQRFITIPSPLTLLQGESGRFYCTSVGTPKPTVSWRFCGVRGITTFDQMKNESEKYQFTEDSLIVSNVFNKDEGTYMCISESPGHTVNVSTELVVHIQPQISLSSSEVAALVGQLVEVTCESTGDPMPVVKWYKLNGDDADKELVETSSTLRFTNVKKEDQAQYICEAESVAGLTREFLALSVKATCKLSVLKYTIPADKYLFLEEERVSIRCQNGFRINGTSNLTCTFAGNWSNPMPLCEDIDECEEAKIIGSGDLVNQDIDDTEPDTCDIYAACVNTVGSYQCICDEGYQMINNKCEYAPPGSENKNPRPATVTPVTTPPPKDYRWLRVLMSEYNASLITQQSYLTRLELFSQEILDYPYSSWKVQALLEILEALFITVKPTTTNALGSRRSAKGTLSNIKVVASIVSNIIDNTLVKDWKQVNKKGNGSVYLMKYVEEYILQSTELLTQNDFINNRDSKLFAPKNIRILLAPVPQPFGSDPLVMSSSSLENTGNDVIIPSNNFQLLEDSIGVVINYRTLHELLPMPTGNDVDRSLIFTPIFSLSFSKLRKPMLAEPILLKFRVKEVPDEKTCSYYDYKISNGGGWATEGCKALNSSSLSEIICECSHLTNFAVLVPMPVSTPGKVIYLTFSYVLAACAGLCVLLVFATCMSHICCTRSKTSDRPAILCNITAAILFGILLLAGGVFLSFKKIVPLSYASYFCYSLLGILQFFGSAFFGWIFSEAVHFFFATRTVIDKGHGRLMLFSFFGWFIPLLFLICTGVLVYFNRLSLQSRCISEISIYLAAVIVGVPSLLFLLATIAMYVVIAASIQKNIDLLSPNVVHHTKRALVCSSGLMFFHTLMMMSAVTFLNSNTTTMLHYLLAGLLAIEGIYLVLYHCFFDRRDIKSNSHQNSKKRNSYSTKEAVTYSPTGTNEVATDAITNGKYLIKSSSKKLSNGDLTKPSPQLRTQNVQEANEWESSYAGMYGGEESSNSPENKPLLAHHQKEGPSHVILEEPDGEEADNESLPATFGYTHIRTSSLPSSRHNSLPRSKKQIMWEDSLSHDSRLLKRSTSKGSSILSIETHTSATNQNLPVYFPAQPPKYEMSLREQHHSPSEPHEQRQQEESGRHGNNKNRHVEEYLDSTDDSRPTSFGIDSDRMSNISSELSNILYELHAFDTKRLPSETHEYVYKETQSKTLPNRRDSNLSSDLSKQSSTFNPQRSYSKTEFHQPPSYTDNNRVRILRGRTRADADPADGLHQTSSDSMYSSL